MGRLFSFWLLRVSLLHLAVYSYFRFFGYLLNGTDWIFLFMWSVGADMYLRLMFASKKANQ